MKFIRNNKIRDRIVDFVSKALLVAVSALVCLWMISGARAGSSEITSIKAETLDDGTQAINFNLTQKLTKDAVSVEFERNFIQVSLKGVSAYPARTENVNSSVLEKVFTYQYQPDLARARVLLKTTAASVKNKSSWDLTPQGLRVLVGGFSKVTVADTVKVKSSATTSGPADLEDERLVKEILEQGPAGKVENSTAAIAASEKKSVVPVEDQPLFASANVSAAEKMEAKGKEESATRVFASLLLVIGVIGACAVGYRRFVLGKGNPFQRQGRLIEVIASQGLGPKRSIAVVKVLDQFMVVGMSGDGMNLLANLGTDVNIEKFIDRSGPGLSFSDTFDGAMLGDLTPAKGVDVAGPAITPKGGIDRAIRASIKKRIEGFKPL